jgi:hypothetical protein
LPIIFREESLLLMHQLANPKLAITLSDTGSLLAVENHLAGETYHLVADTFALETDQGRFSNQATEPVRVTQTQDRLVYHFDSVPKMALSGAA